jgi:hypothetical protein
VPSFSAVLPGLVVVILIVAALGVGYGVFFGYPPRRYQMKVLSRKEQHIVAACAMTLFPARDPMPLDGIEAGIVEYMDQQLSELPRDKRIQVRLLFNFIEHSPWLFHGKRRFSALSPAQREAFLARMATSRLYFRRICFLSLRTLLCMAYFANPAIAARVGSTPNLRPFAEETP